MREASSCSLNEKTLCKGGKIFWDRVVIDVLFHVLEEFGCELEPNGDIFDVKIGVGEFNFIGVDFWENKAKCQKNDAFWT